MFSKSWYVVIIVLGLAAFETNRVFAAGGGARSSLGGRGIAGHTMHGNREHFAPVQNGIGGTPWANGYGNWGWGGFGWGGLYPGWAYQLEGVPYFAQFPPVYYGNGENIPVLNSAIRSPWLGIESGQPAPSAAVSSSLPRPPLRIVNPYYVEEKAENRPAPLR